MDSPSPYFVIWASGLISTSEELRGKFIQEKRPIIWWCPPVFADWNWWPNPDILAKTYGLRQIPAEPINAQLGQRWESKILVPAEWVPLEEEQQG